jgi:hypothetical protein
MVWIRLLMSACHLFAAFSLLDSPAFQQRTKDAIRQSFSPSYANGLFRVRLAGRYQLWLLVDSSLRLKTPIAARLILCKVSVAIADGCTLSIKCYIGLRRSF